MPTFTTRPVYMGTHGVIASGHYLGARAGMRMFDRGGNAIDAAVASGFALAVLEPQSNGIGGEVPILVYTAKEKKPVAISGQGWVGKAATVEWFRQNKIEVIPGDGFLPATVPAAFGSWAFALMRFGTLTLKDVLEPAIDYAASGFPVYPTLREALASVAQRFREEWLSSAAIFLPNNRVPEVGEVLRNPDWAATLKKVVEVEMRERQRGREGAIQAAIDYWYQGEPAERIVTFMQQNAVLDVSGRKHRGLLSRDDFAAWKPTLEEPVTVRYRGLDVYKCGPWTQGPVFLQQLRLLEGFDLKKLGHNSGSYIHTVVEAAKLAYADRERFYGDPAFVDVPLSMLLSPEYAAERRKLIDPKKASLELRPGHGPKSVPEEKPGYPECYRSDTTHTCALDIKGNMVAATPSGGWFQSSPVVPGLGFPMGTRGQLFYLDPHHANVIAPRKRPRTTLTPSLVLKDGRPYLVFGTPGGDQQDQWTLQFFLNYVDFGMNLQEAIDQPTFHSVHFPSSFYPHDAKPGGLVLEGRIPAATRKELAARGHKVEVSGDWAHGKVMAVRYDEQHGVLAGAVSPRREVGYVMGD
ncbi:MAG TPA: gamma-glutamyltransferase family protein [Gemmataceae bacterium]|nr:gamma-glutamyltransferase family protein [Gemmataceae bacterium]